MLFLWIHFDKRKLGFGKWCAEQQSRRVALSFMQSTTNILPCKRTEEKQYTRLKFWYIETESKRKLQIRFYIYNQSNYDR